MRPKHWIKNLLILLPLFFGSAIFDYSLLGRIFLAFISFCLISSAIYVINDIRDLEQDKKNPTKKNRPIASGKVSVKNAIVLAVILMVLSIFINVIINANIYAWAAFLLYFFINIGYSFGLKNIPILDVAILTSGFFIRVLYGSQICGIEISHWLYLTVLSMSFFLGLGKRRNEIDRSDKKTRKVLASYNYQFLDKNMYLCAALTVVFYSLWCVDPIIIQRIGQNIIWTVPLILIILMKYSLNVEETADGDPVETLLNDKVLLGLVLVFVVALAGIIYL